MRLVRLRTPLRRQYRSLTGKAAHAQCLVRACSRGGFRAPGPRAWRLVASGYLRVVCRCGEKRGPAGRNITSSEAGSFIAPPGIRPGTILFREHQNVVHRVIALETGFSWNGRAFTSLSAAARAITGVRWNGEHFFGLPGKPVRLPKSSEEQDKVDREQASALRDLYAGIERSAVRAGLQLSGCSARGGGGLYQEPSARGLATSSASIR